MKARVRLSPVKPVRRSGARPVPLPHKALMISRFGQRAAHVPVFTGPDVVQSLQRRQSDAAALDGAIFLPEGDVSSELVAHELVHALQQGPPDSGELSPETMLARLDLAPALPERSSAETEARLAAGPGPVDPVSQSLPAGVVALRRTGDVGTLDQSPAPPTPAPTPAAPAPAPASEAGTAAPGAEAQGSETVSEIAPTFTLPEAPETAPDPEVAAQRAAEAQAAEEALAAADTPSAVVDAYAGMAPSVKARNMASLGTRIDEANSQSTAEMAAATPPIEARISGSEADMPVPPPIALPGATTAEASATPAAPPVDVPEGPEQPVLTADQTIGNLIERLFGSGAQPEQIDERIDSVSTSNPGVETQITDRADIPLEGANDPARMDEDAAARRGEAGAARGEAAQAVVTGPGPEQVVPRAIEQVVPAPELTPRPLTPLAAAPEAEQMQQLALPEEVVAGFDSATGAQMAATASATRDEMVTAETQRDTDHSAAVAQAETERAAAESQADADQRREIGTQREAIQAERQRTVDQQAAAVEDVNGQAETARQENRTEADAQIATDRAAIAAEYDQAEHDSAAEVAEGERQAEAERERKRREAENQSWWERAVGFIKAAFEALTALVTAIFNVVRSAVTAIIDVARRAVTGLIALAASALQALVSAFGELLKGLIDNLLGAIFPELAAALTSFIDSAVSVVNSAIDAVATVLVDAVNAIAAAVTAACNAILDAFQGAINAALALAQAALTGDWSGFLRQILEAVLRLLGIDPAAFYALIAQATDAIEIIVNDPMHFVGNLVDAFIGGVQLFSEHFLDHLRRGIIGWLTGALGDIQLPTEWNIWSVLDLIRQILGLTWDFLRERAARIIGPENVARLEMAASWIATLVTEGWAGLWARLQDQLDSLKDTVLNAIKSFILERVIMASITWLASLFSPVGAIVKLVMTIWNLYQFVRNQMQRLMGIAQAIVGMISDIAHDVLDPAKRRVEEVLGSLVPVVIDLLMSLLGVTGVATRVREIIADVRQTIANAADRLIERTLVALGLRQAPAPAGAAAPGAPGAAGAAGQIGHPVPVDVAEGEDHTLTIDRTGPGGATVMLRTEPRPITDWLPILTGMLPQQEDEGKRGIARDNIATATRLHGELNPIVDQVASATPAAPRAGTASTATPPPPTPAAAEAIAQKERELAAALKLVFDNLPAAGSSFANQYRADISRAHPSARRKIGDELRTHAGEWVSLPNWAAVVESMKTASDLFQSPLATGRAFGDAVRPLIEARITGSQQFKDRVLTLIFQGVQTNGEAEFLPLRTNLHAMILLGQALDTGAADRAVTKAQETANLSFQERDQALIDEVGRAGGIISFLTTMARSGRVGPISEADLRTKWAVPANADWIDSRFRDAMPDRHEWIPTAYLEAVLTRARQGTPAGEEAGECAALWIKVHHEWRSLTNLIIFKPQGRARREITIETPVPGGETRRQSAVVLQGHSGAIWAAAREGRHTPDDVGEQSQGSPEWHRALTDAFDANRAIANSREAIRGIMSTVVTHARATIWTGTTDPGMEAFLDYYPTRSIGTRLPLSSLVTRGQSAWGSIEADFTRVQGLI